MFGWWKRRKTRAALKCLADTDQSVAASSIASVTDESFKTVVIDRPGVTFVYCYALWCKPCHHMGETVEQVANELRDILFVKLDIEASAESALQWDVSGTPTFLLFENGKLRASRFGSFSAGKLKKWICGHLS